MAAEPLNASFPLFIDKNSKGKTLIFLCENYACRKTVESVVEFKVLINQINQNNYHYKQ